MEINKSLLWVIIMLLAVTLFAQNKVLGDRIEECESKTPQKVQFVEGGDIGKAQTIDSLQNSVDSLTAELYPAEIELNRFKVAYEIFLRRNPKAAKQYGDIISNETE